MPMDAFTYRDAALYAESVPVRNIAEQYGTPTYIYSRAAITQQWHAFDSALKNYPHQICFAVKANSNIAILNILAQLGSGFDIVSGGELARVLAAGGRADKVVFSGVGKTRQEIQYALDMGIQCFNVESVAELMRIQTVAKANDKKAPVSIRVNPDVDAQTHPYISTGLKENKFGVAIDEARVIYQQAKTLSHIDIVGVDCHIGSQLTSVSPFVDALQRVLALVDALSADGIHIRHLDMGGGIGICYQDETPPSPDEYVAAMAPLLAGRTLTLLVEPGRAIVGNAGILLTTVEYIKASEEKHFAIVDGAMNDLLRPALYQSWQNIIPVIQREGQTQRYDIVGPICETGDFLGKERALTIAEGDMLAIESAGAYGFTMSSNYNSRPRAAEVMVDGEKIFCIRERETIASLFEREHIIAQ